MPKTRSKPHPKISQVTIVEGKNNFPISWLNKQGYCEYSIYLENVKNIQMQPTLDMVIGTQEHARLDADFKKDAEPATLEEMLEVSKKHEILSRELPVLSVQHGIRGFIDEIWMTPDEFIIIDDKPGNRAFASSIHQVYGYCLAFKDKVKSLKDLGVGERKISAALRERGTENIFWCSSFDNKAENDIILLINRVQNLILGREKFMSTKNPRKCRSCRLMTKCDKKAWPGSI